MIEPGPVVGDTQAMRSSSSSARAGVTPASRCGTVGRRGLARQAEDRDSESETLTVPPRLAAGPGPGLRARRPGGGSGPSLPDRAGPPRPPGSDSAAPAAQAVRLEPGPVSPAGRGLPAPAAAAAAASSPRPPGSVTLSACGSPGSAEAAAAASTWVNAAAAPGPAPPDGFESGN